MCFLSILGGGQYLPQFLESEGPALKSAIGLGVQLGQVRQRVFRQPLLLDKPIAKSLRNHQIMVYGLRRLAGGLFRVPPAVHIGGGNIRNDKPAARFRDGGNLAYVGDDLFAGEPGGGHGLPPVLKVSGKPFPRSRPFRLDYSPVSEPRPYPLRACLQKSIGFSIKTSARLAYRNELADIPLKFRAGGLGGKAGETALDTEMIHRLDSPDAIGGDTVFFSALALENRHFQFSGDSRHSRHRLAMNALGVMPALALSA